MPEKRQTFHFPIGSIIKERWSDEKFTVMGYVTYETDVFHVLLDEYMEEMDVYIEEYSNWQHVGVA